MAYGRAQRGLGQKPDWPHFYAHLNQALDHGYDWIHGGLYYRGLGNGKVTVSDKVWWAEAELIAALTEALKHEMTPACLAALNQQIQFLTEHQTAPDGIWLESVTADGLPKNTRKAQNWKANYHDVRALQIFIEAFIGAR